MIMRFEARKTVEKRKEELAQKFAALKKKGKISKEDLLSLNITKPTDTVISSVILEMPEAETM